MLLVPRNLQRVGMTGDVPYYGGRFTPAQAYAASHHAAQVVAPAPAPVRAPSAAFSAADQAAALQHLVDSGVITPEEHQELSARVAP